ncbi:MAG: ATPase, partial [Conexibacter sp.]|nr:ATPase [Conexibacter sp.]
GRPAVAVAVDHADLPSLAVSLAAVLRETVGSVGVVAADAHHGALAAAGLAETTGQLSGTIDLLDLQSIKGLEFDATIVIDPTTILDQRPDGGPGGLYTALTRSTRALAILHTTPLPDALATSRDLHHLPASEALTAWRD